MLHFPAVGVAHVHEFDEAQNMAAALEVARHVDHALVVDAAFDHHVDLERPQAHAIGFLDALQNLGHRKIDIVHRAEYRVVERIQADGDAVQTGVFQGLGFLLEQRAVGGEREIEPGFAGQQFDQFFQLPAHQRFAAGDADFFDAVIAENPRPGGGSHRNSATGRAPETGSPGRTLPSACNRCSGNCSGR